MTRSFCLFFMSFALLAVCPARAVTLRGDSVIEKSVIRLSDVFEGVAPERDADIALAPAPGKSVTYDARVLAGLSGRYDLGWTNGANDALTLTRAATIVTSEDIRKAIVEKIEEKRGGDPFDLRFDLRPTGFTLPSGREASFTLSSFEYAKETQRFRADVIAKNDGVPLIQTVSGRVIAKKSVPVLARSMAQGSVVREEDLAFVLADEARLEADVLASSDVVVGRVLTRNKGEGDKFRARDLIAPRSVKRGELVTLRVETNRFLVTAQGKALQDGADGETIRVTNTQSNRVVEGTIVSPGVVRVGAQQTTERTE